MPRNTLTWKKYIWKFNCSTSRPFQKGSVYKVLPIFEVCIFISKTELWKNTAPARRSCLLAHVEPFFHFQNSVGDHTRTMAKDPVCIILIDTCHMFGVQCDWNFAKRWVLSLWWINPETKHGFLYWLNHNLKIEVVFPLFFFGFEGTHSRNVVIAKIPCHLSSKKLGILWLKHQQNLTTTRWYNYV